MSRRSIPHIDKKIIKEIFRETNKSGIASVSTLKIAHRLKISEPVIFAHFHSKQELMEAAFIEAWNTMPLLAPIPVDLSFEKKEECFALYKQKIVEVGAASDELAYIACFLNSSYYNFERVSQIEKPFLDELKAMFHKANPLLDETTLSLIADRFIESSITTLNHVIHQDYAQSEEVLRTLFNVRVYGFVGALHIEEIDNLLLGKKQ